VWAFHLLVQWASTPADVSILGTPALLCFYFNYLNLKNMKKSLIIYFIVFCTTAMFSQSNYYYYYKGEKKYLTIDKKNVNIIVQNYFSKSTVQSVNLKKFDLKENSIGNNKIAEVEFQSEPSETEYLQKVNNLKNNPNVLGVYPFFKRGNNIKPIGTSNLFYVKLKNNTDVGILQEVANQKNVSIVKEVPYMPKWYIISLNKTTIGNAIDLSNQFFETGLFADIDPAFMFNFKNIDDGNVVQNASNNNFFNPSNSNCTNDPFFAFQWGLNSNLGIKFCDATLLSKGIGVKVAVLDQGINLSQSDMQGNFTNISYDAQTNTSPSVYNSNFWHGTSVSSVIGAVGNNNLHIVGVAPLAKIMPVSHDLYANPAWMFPNVSAELASGISWAWQNGADVINNSWGDYGGTFPGLHSTLLENAIATAMINGRGGKGTIVIFTTGNASPSTPIIDYPCNLYPEILSVGATSPSGRCVWSATSGSGYGVELDVVAPGDGIPVLFQPINSAPEMVGNKSGTSYAAPHVSGVVALILSVNPCLTSKQVRDIIEQTCQKINGYSYVNTPGRPNGTWNIEMGYGLIDAHAAVVMAQQMYSASLDLYIKDSQTDIGVQPNTTTQYMWTSDDIWVRNYADNGLVHENPDYSANGNPNYVRVRVKNKSCANSTGTEQLKLYWAKASTALGYPNPWMGGIAHPTTGANMGNPIGTINIPAIQAGQEVILTIPWLVPNPADYGTDGDQWHFCLLARIEATSDPMTFPETGDLNANVRNNNNIAWKNVTVVDVLPNNVINPGGVVAVGNPFNHSKSFYLEMQIADLETGKPIYEEAEVGIKMNDVLYQAWERGGKEAELLKSTVEEKRKIVKGNKVILDNISFNANEMGTIRLDFNFLAKELTQKTNFVYHVIQKDTETGNIIGGETFIINKTPRNIFAADAGLDKDVDKNEPILISASQMSEPAIYNWYDESGNLIFTGKDLTIATQVATKYKLEVIATADGFKDYSEVEVNIKPSILSNISPNPSSDNVIVGYKLNEVGSAYLMIIGGYGTIGTSNNYIIDINSTETNINISTYPNGFYTVALVCNGKIVDAKTLIKQ
jgi:subtilisin family serine protease